METFLVTLAPGAAPARVRQRLAAEAAGRVLLSLQRGQVLIAEFDRARRETVLRWPEVARVGGIGFNGRPIRRFRVDLQGNPLPPAPPPPTA